MNLAAWKDKLLILLIFITGGGCIENYEFVVKDDAPDLVVEAFISDKSFLESVAFPSDGRFFSVKLTTTGNVTNTRPLPVTDAQVELVSNEGGVWHYSETGSGVYSLADSAFKAFAGVKYKLRITLPDDDVFESGWEALPQTPALPMGQITFKEGEKEMFIRLGPNWIPQMKQIVTAQINLPENQAGTAINYRWTFSPTWIYIAPLVPPSHPFGTCWATDRNFINTYALQRDFAGGYQKDLFEMLTVRNARIYHKLSVLVTQHVMTDDYFRFWKEMKEQNDGSPLHDIPPYNLDTNFNCVTGERKALGYFGVVREQATRWYFTKQELSYFVENTLAADCLSVEDIAPECENCLLYSFGEVTNVRPKWWQN